MISKEGGSNDRIAQYIPLDPGERKLYINIFKLLPDPRTEKRKPRSLKTGLFTGSIAESLMTDQLEMELETEEYIRRIQALNSIKDRLVHIFGVAEQNSGLMTGAGAG